MIVILKENTPKEVQEQFIAQLKQYQLEVHRSQGVHTTLLGLVGDTSAVDVSKIESQSFVQEVKRIQEPYKKANRKFHPADTVVEVGGVPIGGDHFQVIAGPCSVETEKQVCQVAEQVKKAGAALLRGGAFKPRTSPYNFQGLGEQGLGFLVQAKKTAGLPIVTELMSEEDLPLFAPVDLIQIGARNMQKFRLLKAVGRQNKPVLLKRGLANTIEEFLMSAEYIMAEGNENVILCERGIRTFETKMRNTLDLAAVSLLKELTHLPVIVDPSHATGLPRLVEPMSLAAIAAGADGLMIEVHNNPEKALCDGPQSLRPEAFAAVMEKIQKTKAFFQTL